MDLEFVTSRRKPREPSSSSSSVCNLPVSSDPLELTETISKSIQSTEEEVAYLTDLIKTTLEQNQKLRSDVETWAHVAEELRKEYPEAFVFAKEEILRRMSVSEADP
ncbi:hypothetical protein GEMRC1_004250 [Eukaryota sp. GEM-RC1]